MFDPNDRVRERLIRQPRRRGAIVPLFAILLPMLLIFSGFAINMAYMQLVSTELKITTDTAAHAGGRAMSVAQSDPSLTNEEKRLKAINDGIELATEIAQINTVVGKQLSVGDGTGNSQINITFGKSIRTNNGAGMYQFNETPMATVMSGGKRPSSLAVTGNLDLPMIFSVMKNHKYDVVDKDTNSVVASFDAADNNRYAPVRRSVATQVDRDIALVLDRSGSMLTYRDQDAMDDRVQELYDNPIEVTVPGYRKYHYWRRWNGWWYDKGYHRPEDAYGSWQIRNHNDTRWVNGYTYEQERITYWEKVDAQAWLYDKYFSSNVIYQMEKWENANHTLGSHYSSSENYKLTSEMAKYAHDWKFVSGAPRYSRWWYLEQGVDAFLNVLDITDQTELVSLVTFNSSATANYSLQSNYNNIRDTIEDISPTGGTAIGDGMTEGLPLIISGNLSRPFAAKTIVVLTDGESNAGEDPVTAVENIVDSAEVTVHTVTFTQGADKAAMREVAEIGFGRHYHADDGSTLIPIFEEIANNLPTILTE